MFVGSQKVGALFPNVADSNSNGPILFAQNVPQCTKVIHPSLNHCLQMHQLQIEWHLVNQNDCSHHGMWQAKLHLQCIASIPFPSSLLVATATVEGTILGARLLGKYLAESSEAAH